MTKSIAKESMGNIHMVLSTIPGPSDGYVFDGMKSKSLVTSMTVIECYEHSGFMVSCLNNKITVSFTTYRDWIDDPEEFMQIVN